VAAAIASARIFVVKGPALPPAADAQPADLGAADPTGSAGIPATSTP